MNLTTSTVAILSCLKWTLRKSQNRRQEPPGGENESQPSQDDDTVRQKRLREKLRTLQMLRALRQGFMPSNQQAIDNLERLRSSSLLDPDSSLLSSSGRALTQSTRILIQQLVQLLLHKNGKDQLQNFIWFLAKAKIDPHLGKVQAKAAASSSKAGKTAAAAGVKHVASILVTNSEFRTILAGVNAIGRDVFRSTAFSLASVSDWAGQQVEPSAADLEALKQTEAAPSSPPSTRKLEKQVAEVKNVLTSGASTVAESARQRLSENLGQEEERALLHHLKQAIHRARKRKDYSETVSTLSELLRRQLRAYANVASDTVEAVEENVEMNDEATFAALNLWRFTTSFGEKQAWTRLEESFKHLVEANRSDPEMDEVVDDIADTVQQALTNPTFFDKARGRLDSIWTRSKKIRSKTRIAKDLNGILENSQTALGSIGRDGDLRKLFQTTSRVARLVTSKEDFLDGSFFEDALNVFLPRLIEAVQFVPIPRLEVSTPAIDLLLENVVLEPGQTVERSSFLPHKLRISTQSSAELRRKAPLGTESSLTSLVTISLAGLSIAAEEVGYWLRLHSGPLRLSDEGLASFRLDKRGIDLDVEVEIGRDRIEKMVSLRRVDVRIHYFNYKLRQSKFTLPAWVLKPLLRPIIKKALEVKISSAIEEGLHTLNRELLFARERLRAARIANPKDALAFIRAVAARATSSADSDVQTSLSVRPTGGVFRGRYAPGSLVKVWEDEGREAERRVREFSKEGWRNNLFDLRPAPSGSVQEAGEENAE